MAILPPTADTLNLRQTIERYLPKESVEQKVKKFIPNIEQDALNTAVQEVYRDIHWVLSDQSSLSIIRNATTSLTVSHRLAVPEEGYLQDLRITQLMHASAEVLGTLNIRFNSNIFKTVRNICDPHKNPEALVYKFDEIKEAVEAPQEHYITIKWECNNPLIYSEMERTKPKAVSQRNQKLWQACLSKSAHTDVTLIVNNTPIAVHRDILAANSSFFKALFDSPLQGDKVSENTYSLNEIEITPEQFKIYLEYAYTESLDLEKIPLADLLAVAKCMHHIDDQEGFALCKAGLKHHVCRNNFWPLLRFVKTYKVDELRPLLALTAKEFPNGLMRRLNSEDLTLQKLVTTAELLKWLGVNALDKSLYETIGQKLSIDTFLPTCQAAFGDNELKCQCKKYVKANLDHFNANASSEAKETYILLMIGVRLK